jgi:predicted DNA-binding transcriptional regulator YafY
MVYRPTARVLTVLDLLQTHGSMTGVELARRLEVDTRTIRRYITTLQDMGIPIESEPGRYGGYTLRPGFKLPPLMFSDDEVMVLTLGLLMARRFGLSGAGASVESALAKIERVLPLGLRQQHRALQEAWLLDDSGRDERLVETDRVTTFSVASQQQKQVRLVYESKGEHTERVIDPYGVVYHHQGRWYVVGYCHLRDDLRIFRLDRVTSAQQLDSAWAVPPPPDFDAVEYLLLSFGWIVDRWDIDVLLDMPLEEAREQIPHGLARLTQDGDRVRLHASLHDLDYFARQLIRLGCPFEIVQPPELGDALLAIADEIQNYVLL